MAIQKSYLIDDYIQKLIWLESVSTIMSELGHGWLCWDTKFDGEYFILNVWHIGEE
jgi:hypothetical protein